ncbi:hypothetical protein U9M48_005539 [Paspalum notatum var. saurae]|uniref:Leucine-rich repeat-containing N-terminal plant-type domain-containing protein n=1 Tax=Paspalum notatum var. saurae TaxID=547442 RepID=A0AAQ3PVW3_PASNO
MAPLASACCRLLLLLALLPCCSLAADEAALLLQIKTAWGDPPALAGWNITSATGRHRCMWPHVGCNPAGRIVSLRLSGAGLTGHFPDAVGDLSALTHLDVSNNTISGAFPTALYRCASLRYLDLSRNNLSGELPPDISRRLGPNLTKLFLSGNQFRGAIPGDLGSLTRLRNLVADQCNLGWLRWLRNAWNPWPRTFLT